MRRWLRWLTDHSLLLVLGALAGLLWANLAPTSYARVSHFALLENPFIGELHGQTRAITLHYLVNDLAMALFFALAGKEIWVACLPGGALQDLRSAASPLCATLGGMLGPALVYLGGAAAIGQWAQLAPGWAIPCATDIAFSYLVARGLFGAAHPAIPFLLLLAIADDALGLIILALFYPVAPVQPLWLALAAAAVLWGLWLRRRVVSSFWPYLLGPGALSWAGFALSGLHPALGLLPVIPTLPHRQVARRDTLGEFEHWWKRPVEWILGLFGLLNAGVALGAFGPASALVLAGLWIGKPLGILGAGWLAARAFGLRLPPGMGNRELAVVGFAASIGFTVALFVSSVAFAPGPVQDAAKMGALASLGAGLITWAAARVLLPKRIAGRRAVPEI